MRPRVLLRNRPVRTGLTAAAFLALVLVSRAIPVMADSGDTANAVLQGEWQINTVIGGYTGPGSQTYSRLPVGHRDAVVILFLSSCNIPGACPVDIQVPPNSPVNTGNLEFPYEAGGNGTPPTYFPFTQKGNAYSITFPILGGYGGQNLPPCRPPPLELHFRVTSAVQDASGWKATQIVGSETSAVYWSCTGGAPRSLVVNFTGAPVGLKVPLPTAENPDRSTIASGLPNPRDWLGSPALVISNAAITLALILFITFPSQLFNKTFEENYDEIRAIIDRRIPWAARVQARLKAEGDRGGNRVVFVAVLLVGALLGGLLDPRFGFTYSSAATYAAVILATLLGMSVGAAVNYSYRRLRGLSTTARLHALPAGLVVAAGCVLISRLSSFQPGYLYGLIVGVAFSGSLAREQQGHTVALGSTATLVVAVAAWLVWGMVDPVAAQPGAAFPVLVLDTVLAATFIGGLVGSVITLVPLRFLPGATLASWNRKLWAVIYGVAVFGMVQIMLRPGSPKPHPGQVPVVTMLILFVAFGGGSIAFRYYFERRRRQVPATPQ